MALDFVTGCVGGMAGVVVGHPLDTVKVILQTQNTSNPKYKGSMDCLRSLLTKEGVRGVYRGVTSPLLGVAGINAIVFGVYGNSQRSMKDPDALKTHAVAGAVSGLFQSFICSPMELAKSRLQVNEFNSNGPVQCLRNIYDRQGIKGVFRGTGLTILRDVPAFSIYFFTYEVLTRTDTNTPVPTWTMLLAGGLAGVMSWVAVYPADVIKSRMQVDGSSQYTNSFDCLKKSIRNDGVSCLFRGITPTVIRAFPVNAVTFTVVTWTMRILSGEKLTETVRGTESILERYADVVCTLKVVEESPS